MSVTVLDHGYVLFVEAWGRGLDGQMEAAIIEAARMSTGKGFQGWGGASCPDCDMAGRLALNDKLYKTHEHMKEAEKLCRCRGTGVTIGDEKLLEFLWTNRHTTPFEMAGMTIEVQAPIMVFREWHRHRTQSYNEMSARYTPLPDVNYLPTVERCLMISAHNKQAQGTGAVLTHEVALKWLALLAEAYEFSQEVYQAGLTVGIPKEVARLSVPVGRYSRMRASSNLLNWLRFLGLRRPENAQWEIRQYANAVFDIVQEHFPRTAALFEVKPL
jgi:thymidylate synthase (FAD)